MALDTPDCSILCMAPNMHIQGSLSQLGKPNLIYYLWKDINSGDCDPFGLSGPVKPSIFIFSIPGSEFMWCVGCNVIYVNNAL